MRKTVPIENIGLVLVLGFALDVTQVFRLDIGVGVFYCSRVVGY